MTMETLWKQQMVGGYKSLESAEKAALYADMRAERRMRKHRNPSSYDIDMEMADCYYGYNQADFY